MIFRDLHWRRNHGRLRGKFWMLVADNNLRRRDLHHRKLWQSSLGCRQRIMVSPASASTDDLFGGPENVGVRRRRDEGYYLSLAGWLYDLMSKSSGREKKSYQHNVDDQ